MHVMLWINDILLHALSFSMPERVKNVSAIVCIMMTKVVYVSVLKRMPGVELWNV
jgi:hypothetical protein